MVAQIKSQRQVWTTKASCGNVRSLGLLLSQNQRYKATTQNYRHSLCEIYSLKKIIYLCVYTGILPACMYVCMHACMHVCMHYILCMYICMHACMCVCMHVCAYVCLQVCTYVCASSMCLIPTEARRGQQIAGARVTDGCEPPCGAGN